MNVDCLPWRTVLMDNDPRADHNVGDAAWLLEEGRREPWGCGWTVWGAGHWGAKGEDPKAQKVHPLLGSSRLPRQPVVIPSNVPIQKIECSEYLISSKTRLACFYKHIYTHTHPLRSHLCLSLYCCFSLSYCLSLISVLSLSLCLSLSPHLCLSVPCTSCICFSLCLSVSVAVSPLCLSACASYFSRL